MGWGVPEHESIYEVRMGDLLLTGEVAGLCMCCVQHHGQLEQVSCCFPSHSAQASVNTGVTGFPGCVQLCADGVWNGITFRNRAALVMRKED